MSEVPSNLIPTRVTQLPTAPVADENSLMMIVYQGNNYQIRVGDLLNVAGVPTSRQVIAGTGLTGGGQLTSNVTLSVANGGIGTTQLAASGVTAGTYGDATNIPVFIVDATGRVTAATTVPASGGGGVPTSTQVIAGTGLNGGGALTGNVTLNANLSSATPQSLDGAGSAGASTDIARADHTHPAVDLADQNQVDGILPVDQGGTSRSLVPDEGAIVWSGADGLYIGPAGVAGQVLLSGGIGEYTWADQNNLDVGQADNINGGSANQLLYQTAADTTGFVPAPTVSNTVLYWNGTNVVWGSVPGTGTVVSVGLALPPDFTVSGSPVTTSGTLTGAWAAQNPNIVFAGPASGASPATPSFRSLSSADIPTLNQNTTGNAATATTATNIAGGAAGSVPYQTGSGATSLLPAGTGVLVGGATPSYTTTPTLTGTNFSAIPNAALSNSSVTIGSTGVALGATASSLAGLSSVTLTGNPTLALQATTKQYVDALIASGIHFHTPVMVESPTNLNATYNNGTAGVGATLTNAGTQVELIIDGVFTSPGDRVLVYNQTNQIENGIYVVTVVGTVSTNWVLTRASDADTYVINDANGLSEGSTVFVQLGATGSGNTYTCNTSGVITFGTTPITFVQISTAQIYSAGTGLTLTGTEFSLTTPVSATNGGVGQSSYTTGDIIYATGSTTLNKLGIGASSRIMTSTGSAPIWTDPASVTVGSATTATTATNIAGGSANSIAYNTGSGATNFITAPTVSNTYLEWSGSAFQWSSNPLGTVTSVDVSGGTTGLTTSGGPITSSGTITLAGTLAVANGGTGATTTANALTNLGAYPASNPSGYTTNTGTVTSVTGGSYLTGGTITTSGTLAVDATSANTVSKVVARDASGNFAAGQITATSYVGMDGGTF